MSPVRVAPSIAIVSRGGEERCISFGEIDDSRISP